MKKHLLLIIFIATYTCRGFAAGSPLDDLLSVVKLIPATTSQAQITATLGVPTKIEESKKKSWWYFTRGSATLIICWNNKSTKAEQLWLNSTATERIVFNERQAHQLKSGITDVETTLALLGLPRDMTVKTLTQEMHYYYKNGILRLFFRKQILIDYTLLFRK